MKAELLVTLLLGLSACGGDGGAASGSASARASAAPAASSAAPVSSVATSAPPAASSAPAAACAIQGEWGGTYPAGPYPFSGKPIAMSFNADGKGGTDDARGKNEFTYTATPAEVAFKGTKETRTGKFSCGTEEGKWGTTFSADCKTVTFKLVSDPCKGRATTLDGLTLTRK